MVTPNNFDALRNLQQALRTKPATTTSGVPGGIRKLGGVSAEVRQSSSELDTARMNAAKRILADPIARKNNPQFLLKDLEKIARGESTDDGGILGGVGRIAKGALEGAVYALGRPLAVVASAGKEVSDIASGQASVSDFVKQALDKDTTVSKYLPKSGNRWLDGIIGFVGDVAFDPLTYVTFGASAYAGRAGRMALSTKAATTEALQKAPSLLAKVNDGSIARLGEWALTKAEKEALDIQSGVSWAWGGKGVIGKEGTALGKLSEKTALAVGKPFAQVRGAAGRSKVFKPLQELTTPGSVKAVGLSRYGRVKDPDEVTDVVRRLASATGATHANAAGRMVQLKFGSRGQELVSEIANYEAKTGRRIHEVREGVRTAADDVEQDLVSRMTTFLDELRAEANTTTADFASRRGATAYDIAHRDNYVPHTLTKEAREYIASTKWTGNTQMSTNIRNMLDLSPTDLIKGPAPLRARTLKQGDSWLGEPLSSKIDDAGAASMREINDISQDKLGFKWFEEDGAQYLDNYLNSVVNQTKRVAFTDRLFDFGPEVVKTFTRTIIPDAKLAKLYEDGVELYGDLARSVLDDFADAVSQGTGQLDDVLAPRIEFAKALADSRPGDNILSPEQITRMRSAFDTVINKIAEADGVASSLPESVREAYETISSPLRSRLKDIRTALDANDQENLIAITGLRDFYQRLFPDAQLIPSDPRALAEDIVDGIYSMRGISPSATDQTTNVAGNIVARESKLDIVSPGGRVTPTTPESARKAVAALESQLAQKQNALDAIESLSRTSDELAGQSAATAARQDIPRLQQEIADISRQRDEALRGITLAKTEADELTDVLKVGLSERQAGKVTARLEELGVVDPNVKRTKDGTRVNPLDKAEKNVKVSAARRTALREAQVDEATALVDAVRPLKASRDDWDATVGRIYNEDLATVTRLAEERPPAGAAADITAQWLEKTLKTMESVRAPGIGLSLGEQDAISRVLTTMKGLESELALFEQARDLSAEQLSKVLGGELGDASFVDDIIEGWEHIESLGVQMPPEVRDIMFERVKSLRKPENASAFKKMYDSYTKFFKITAMLTPGFIVRNSYTAAFNNFVAGVTLKETRQGLAFATKVWRNGLDSALASVPRESRDLYERALKVAYATGAGQTADDILAPVLAGKGAKWVNKQPVKVWSNLNETAEVAARFSLALSSIKKGLDFDASVGLVSRYHFDYTDLSSLDEAMRKVMPFWIFASRNIPLQLVNQVARPRIYRTYQALQNNFGISEDDPTFYPEWLRRRNPLQFPGMKPGSVINLDLPQVDMLEQISMMTDPMRLLSQANPLVKLPVELMGGRQLYQNIPFSEKKVDVRGPLDYPAFLAGLLNGGAGRRPDGSFYTTSRANYALPNLLPTLGTLQRLIPQAGGSERYIDRQGSSVAGFFGLPYRSVSQGEQSNELTRRQFVIQNYLSNLTRTGQLRPKE